MTARSFAEVLKDQPTDTGVHVPTSGGSVKPRVRLFRDVMAAASKHVADMPGNPNVVGKRDLQPHDGETMKAPFRYDPNFLSSLRPDQVPRFYSALTDAGKLPTKTVNLADLIATQDRVDPDKVEALRGGKADKKAVVVTHNGADHIADGHHRLAADWLDGKETAEVHHKDISDVSNALKGADAEWTVTATILKIDPDRRLVYGWASVIEENGQTIVDSQDDMITADDLVKAAHGYMREHRNVGLAHLDFGKQYGDTVESLVFTKEVQAALGIDLKKVGWFICHHVADNDLWKDVKAGKYPAFSIGGSGKRVSFQA